MLHLTHTGPYAGDTLCGIARERRPDDGATYQHPAYDRDQRARQIDAACADCAHIAECELLDASCAECARILVI